MGKYMLTTSSWVKNENKKKSRKKEQTLKNKKEIRFVNVKNRTKGISKKATYSRRYTNRSKEKNSPSIFKDGKFRSVKEKEWKPSPSPKNECFKFLVKRIKKDKKGAAFPVAALAVSNRKTKRRNKTKKRRKCRFLNKCNFAYAGHDTVNISLTTLKRSTSSSTDVRK